MGHDHARILEEDVPDATLQVVCDVAEAAARRTADRYGAVDAVTDAFAAIAREDVDAVLIASPDPTHAPLTLAALEARKPVLCEKPLAPDVASCLEVMAAEEALGALLVQVGFMRRFDPTYVAMKDAGADLGQAVMMHNFHRNVEAPAGFTPAMAITNSAPHEFDIARFVLDTEISAIAAYAPDSNVGTACRPVVMVLRTAAGQLVTIEVNNNAAYGYDVRAELVGTTGSANLPAEPSVRVDTSLKAANTYSADWRPRFAEAYRLQNKAWIGAIQSGVPAPGAATTWDGYCATAIATAGEAALAAGVMMPVELIPVPAFYAGQGVAA